MSTVKLIFGKKLSLNHGSWEINNCKLSEELEHPKAHHEQRVAFSSIVDYQLRDLHYNVGKITTP